MAARGNIAINDGETVPVLRTFVPYGVLPGTRVSQWMKVDTASPAANEIMTLSVKKQLPSLENVSVPGRKVAPDSTEVRLKIPSKYVDTPTGLTLVDFVDESVTRFNMHPRSATQRRKNLRVLTINALYHATMVAAVDSSEDVW